jgi:hypothetical protein
MTTAEAIFTALTADSAVSALVSDRIYPSVVQSPGVLTPYVIYQHISSDPAVTHGEAAGAIGRGYQFACFAETALQAEQVRDAVVAALDSVALENGDNPTLEDLRTGGFDEVVELHRADCDFLI